jgi:hypothetical protein
MRESCFRDSRIQTGPETPVRFVATPTPLIVGPLQKVDPHFVHTPIAKIDSSTPDLRQKLNKIPAYL